MLRYVVHKGSITVDGISLTVAAVHDDGFAIAVIPHTLAVTTLGARAVGARVNLEVDLIAKYVEALVRLPARKHAMTFDAVERAIDAVRRGEFVVVVDDEDRENEGDLIIAAEKMTPDKMAFMIRYTSGVICLPMEGARLDELQLPLMVVGHREHRGPAHRVHRLGRRQASARPPASPRPTAARRCTR